MVSPRGLRSMLWPFAATLALGCAEAETDDEGGGGASDGGSDQGGAALGGGGAGGDGGDGGAGGAPPMPSCEPVEEGLVGEDCGLFVDPSASLGGDGSQLTPFRTIGAAIAAASSSSVPIYVCANELQENVILDPGRTLFGGITCDGDWSWNLAGRTPLTADPGTVPLTISGGDSEASVTTVSGFDVAAQDGVLVSESSIAAIVDGGFAAFERVSLAAGNGVAGNPSFEGQSPAGASGLSGENGVGIVGGGPGGGSACGSVGGDGGAQIAGFNTGGDEGEPDQNNGGATVGNLGAAVCENGGPGADGADGVDGVDASGLGSIDVFGFTPASGTPGTDGQHAGGGGGGGSVFNSAGGGGGGGGCGGIGGVAGLGGGSSIALIVLDASLALSDITFAVGSGGDGGFGWLGGAGGSGGGGGQGVGTACDGAAGGAGGAAGRGGGGAGGHALVVAYAGAPPDLEGIQLPEPQAEQAGLGGGDAPDGVAAQSLQF
jgi:hypothetical protein